MVILVHTSGQTTDMLLKDIQHFYKHEDAKGDMIYLIAARNRLYSVTQECWEKTRKKHAERNYS